MGMIFPNMGKKATPPTSTLAPTGLADALFTPVQQRVLGLLFGQPDRQFQTGELIRLTAAGTGAPHRLLTRLEKAGLVATERIGNQKYYRANRDSPVFQEMHGLIVKTSGLVIPIGAALQPLADRINAAFVYGSIAKGADSASSDIDVMVISDSLDYTEVYEALASAESALGRTINPVVMSARDWRLKSGEAGFVARVASQPKLFVIGMEDDLVQSR